jgi:hypothetical protein
MKNNKDMETKHLQWKKKAKLSLFRYALDEVYYLRISQKFNLAASLKPKTF